MAKSLKRPLFIALGALAASALGGCYYGDVYGASYASGGDCAARYGDAYYDYDGYAYADGYGYDCYDASDYGGGFVNIGFGGGWYDDYYYPGYGLWMFDNYRNRYPLRGHYLNYWGGRRAWWKHHGGRKDWKPGRPGWHRDRDDDGPRGTRPGRPGWNRGDGDGRPGRWNRGDRDGDGPRGTRPGRPDMPPVAGNPPRPDRGPGAARPHPGRGEREPAARPSRHIRDVIAPRDDVSGPRAPRPGAAASGTGNSGRQDWGAGRARPAPSAAPSRPPRAERTAPARSRNSNERPE
jgi:hypothetical protein